MCGIYGSIGDFSFSEQHGLENFIVDYMYAGVLRGKDGTGWMSYGAPETSVYWHKQPVPGFSFAESSAMKDLIKRSRQSRFVAVHHRFATSGNITEENCHPFMVRSSSEVPVIMGVHNGTMHHVHGEFPQFDVDSEKLFNSIAEYGPEEALAKSHGAFALVWYDFRDCNLYMLRNSRRPLSLVRGKHGGFLFGSEAGALVSIADRNKMLVELKALSLKEEVLYSWKLPAKGDYFSGADYSTKKLDLNWAWEGQSYYTSRNLLVKDAVTNVTVVMRSLSYDSGNKTLSGRGVVEFEGKKNTKSFTTSDFSLYVDAEVGETLAKFYAVPVRLNSIWKSTTGGVWPGFEALAEPCTLAELQEFENDNTIIDKIPEKEAEILKELAEIYYKETEESQENTKRKLH